MNVITLIVPLFLLIVLGYCLKQFRFLSEEEAGTLNKVAFYIALPALLFESIASFSLREIFSLELVVGGIIVTLLLFGGAYHAGFWLKQKQKGSFVTCCFRANLGYLGLPIVAASIGQSGIAKAAILQATLVPVYVALTIMILLKEEKTGKMYILKKTITNPLFIATALGILCSALHIPLPGTLSSSLGLLSDISLPLVLIVIGTRLDATNIRAYLPTNIASALFKLACAPFLMYLFFRYGMPSDLETIKVGILMMAMPTAIATYAFTKEFGADDKLAASAVSFNTLLSLLTIPLVIYLITYL